AAGVAAVAVLEIAVVAGLLRALEAVAADVVLAVAQARRRVAVVGAEIALLVVLPDQPVTAHGGLTARRALAGVGVERAVVALLVFGVHELVAAGGRDAGVEARVEVAVVGVVTLLADVDDPVAASPQRAL